MARATPVLHQNGLFFTFQSRDSHTLFFNSQKSLLPTNNPLSSSAKLSQSQPPSCLRTTRVTAVPVDYAPPAPDFNFHKELTRLLTLRSNFSTSKTLTNKIQVIDCDSRVRQLSRVFESLNNLDTYELLSLKCVVAAGQEHVIGLDYYTDSVGVSLSPQGVP